MANFCPECGTKTERHFVAGRERDACPACGYVEFARTKIGVGALVFRGDSVLLVERSSRDNTDGLWTIPSGYQEMDETLEEAVVREVWEETSLRVHPKGIVFIRNMHERGAIDCYSVFLCEADSKDDMPDVNDDESTQVHFVPQEAFDEINLEPDSRWFIETYLELQPEPMLAIANPFKHPKLQIFTA
jgi:ADP-ribose pyrophosphatase YjhB (NUDIX family)